MTILLWYVLRISGTLNLMLFVHVTESFSSYNFIVISSVRITEDEVFK